MGALPLMAAKAAVARRRGGSPVSPRCLGGVIAATPRIAGRLEPDRRTSERVWASSTPASVVSSRSLLSSAREVGPHARPGGEQGGRPRRG